MKLYIGIDTEKVSGYTTLSSIPYEDVIISNMRNIDDIVDASECNEICAPDILDYVHQNELGPLVRYYVSKLRHGGTIILGGTNLYEVFRQYSIGNYNDDTVRALMFGEQLSAQHIKMGLYNPNLISDMLRKLGLKIQSIKISNLKFSVEAYRE